LFSINLIRTTTTAIKSNKRQLHTRASIEKRIRKITYAINARDLKKIWKNQICACTWIETMTSAGITLYLAAAMYNYILVAMSAALSAGLI
jgi:hypothetical protein